jgi:hypothetical protein
MHRHPVTVCLFISATAFSAFRLNPVIETRQHYLPGNRHFKCSIKVLIPGTLKFTKMKKFKMLMMAVLTLTSVSIFAQVAPNNQKFAKLNSEKAKYTCPVHPNMVTDNLSKCQDLRSSLNLSLKEKMKREEMKSISLMNSEVRRYLPCSLSKDYTALNLSPKEKMKWEAMRINNSHSDSYVNAANTCQMMNVLISDKQISCQYCSSSFNLSPKEKMKREAMKI